MIWQAKEHRFEFPGPVLLMGVVNATPDSFSDGGQFLGADQAIRHGLELVAEGADILDIGGESTRPRAEEVSEAEEIRRVLPVIAGVREKSPVIISIDTRKAGVARAAVAAGAQIINDIAANRDDPEMWDVVAETKAGYVLTHMQGTPQSMQINPTYKDVVAEVGAFFAERLRMAQSRGVPFENVALDPGIGFGKTIDHNLQLLAELSGFRIHQRPVLLGASRKSFIGKLLGAELNERLPGSVACALWAVWNGAQILRVHDVRATRQAVRMIEEITKRCRK
jgi:dihydropteroate synthase